MFQYTCSTDVHATHEHTVSTFSSTDHTLGVGSYELCLEWDLTWISLLRDFLAFLGNFGFGCLGVWGSSSSSSSSCSCSWVLIFLRVCKKITKHHKHQQFEISKAYDSSHTATQCQRKTTVKYNGRVFVEADVIIEIFNHTLTFTTPWISFVKGEPGSVECCRGLWTSSLKKFEKKCNDFLSQPL